MSYNTNVDIEFVKRLVEDKLVACSGVEIEVLLVFVDTCKNKEQMSLCQILSDQIPFI